MEITTKNAQNDIASGAPRNNYEKYQKEQFAKLREERRKEKISGKIGSRRLAWAKNLIIESKIPMKVISRKAGMSDQTLYNAFAVMDDIYIDNLKKILEVIGIKCDVTLKPKNEPDDKDKDDTKDVYEFEGDVVIPGEPSKVYTLPKELTSIGKDAELRFVVDFFISTGLGITEIQRRAKISQSGMKYIFTNDRIKVSTLKNIANGLDGKIVWRLKRIKQD